MYIIKDWAGNILFDHKTFKTFLDAWEFIYETFPDQADEFYDEYYVELI